MIPEPKYKIGQTVYHASYITTSKEIICPDCQGQRVWHVTTPAEETFDIKCSTCTRGYDSPSGTTDILYIGPQVLIRTIGSIRIDTGNSERPVEYMCVETGVGSGTLYDEKSLFATHEEALALANKMAEGINNQKKDTDTKYNKKKYDGRYKPMYQALAFNVRELISLLIKHGAKSSQVKEFVNERKYSVVGLAEIFNTIKTIYV